MSSLFRLDGRVALVTGAGGRLGTATATALAEAGARVVLTGRDEGALANAAEAVGEAAIAAIPADLLDDDQLNGLFEQVRAEAGGLDILVNNAGRASSSRLGSTPREEFDAVLRLNVTSAFLCAQAGAAIMSERGGGKIVNVGSIYGAVAADRRLYEGSPEMVQASPAYIASKSALVNLTRDLAVQLAPSNVQVNLVSPGGVSAEQPADFQKRYAARTPAGRMATPQDVVGAIVFLAAPASSYVTGQEILVDGGFTAW